MIKVPENCLVCGSKYQGGTNSTGEGMTEGKRVFYVCGASMSVKKLEHNVYNILFKNCGNV
jgi:hypothetical protein